MAFLLIGDAVIPLRLREKLLPDLAMSTRLDACGAYILSCPDLIGHPSIFEGGFEVDGVPGQARQ